MMSSTFQLCWTFPLQTKHSCAQLTKAYGTEPLCISVVIDSAMYLLKIKLLDINNIRSNEPHNIISRTRCYHSPRCQYMVICIAIQFATNQLELCL